MRARILVKSSVQSFFLIVLANGRSAIAPPPGLIQPLVLKSCQSTQ